MKYLDKRTFIISLVLFAFLLMIFFILFKVSERNRTVSEKVTNEGTVVQDTSEIRFQKNYVEGIIPQEWEFKEYTDNRGMYLKTDNVQYTGLTGFEILTKQNIIFSFRGVDGVGGINVCNPIFKFRDTSDTYVLDKISGYKEILNTEVSPQVIDLGLEYVELEMFGRKARRINSDLYWNVEGTNSKFFHPECGNTVYTVFNFPNSTVSTGYVQSYHIEINTTLQSDLLKLDKVLNSLELR